MPRQNGPVTERRQPRHGRDLDALERARHIRTATCAPYKKTIAKRFSYLTSAFYWRNCALDAEYNARVQMLGKREMMFTVATRRATRGTDIPDLPAVGEKYTLRSSIGATVELTVTAVDSMYARGRTAVVTGTVTARSDAATQTQRT